MTDVRKTYEFVAKNKPRQKAKQCAPVTGWSPVGWSQPDLPAKGPEGVLPYTSGARLG